MNLSPFNITNSSDNMNGSKKINEGITRFVLQGILNFIGFIINSIAMIHSFRHRNAPMVIRYLLRNLFSSNILNSLTWMIATVNIIVANVAGWPFSAMDITCKLKFLFWLMCYAISVGTLTLLSIERHRAIIYPTKPRLRGRKLNFILLIIWLSSAITSFPIFFISTIDIAFKFNCSLRIAKSSILHFIYLIFLQIVDYIIPLFTMLYCYSQLIFKLKTTSRNVITNKKALSGRERRKRRIIKMLICLTVCFIVTATPWMFRFNTALFRNNMVSLIPEHIYNSFLELYVQSIPLVILLSLTYDPVFYFLISRYNHQVSNVRSLGNQRPSSRRFTVVNI